LNLQEGVTFEMVCQDKLLLISIKPIVDEMGQDVILGTAMDMTGVFPRRSILSRLGKKKIKTSK
jgi:hypothetical protein